MKTELIWNGNGFTSVQEPDSFDKFMSKAVPILNVGNTALNMYDTWQDIGNKREYNNAQINNFDSKADYNTAMANKINASESFLDSPVEETYNYDPAQGPISQEAYNKEAITRREQEYNTQQTQDATKLALTQAQLENQEFQNQISALDVFRRGTVNSTLQNGAKAISYLNNNVAPEIVAQMLTADTGMEWGVGQDEQNGTFFIVTDMNGNQQKLPINTPDQTKTAFLSPPVLTTMVAQKGRQQVESMPPQKKIELTQSLITNTMERWGGDYSSLERAAKDPQNPRQMEAQKTILQLKEYQKAMQTIYQQQVTGVSPQQGQTNVKEPKSKFEEGIVLDTEAPSPATDNRVPNNPETKNTALKIVDPDPPPMPTGERIALGNELFKLPQSTPAQAQSTPAQGGQPVLPPTPAASPSQLLTSLATLNNGGYVNTNGEIVYPNLSEAEMQSTMSFLDREGLNPTATQREDGTLIVKINQGGSATALKNLPTNYWK